MIYISQGHEHSIGLEVFIKSFILLNSKEQSEFKLFTFKDSLLQILNSINVDYEIKEEHIIFNNCKLACSFLNKIQDTQSNTSLLKILPMLTKDDILITLPTSKDQLYLDGKQKNGYTEFFRSYYQNSEIGMAFLSNESNFLLLSDHIPISKISSFLNPKSIVRKVQLSIDKLRDNKIEINEVYFSGINPHCCENGLLGKEDGMINESVQTLSQQYEKIKFHGPISADVLFHNQKNKKQLFIYAYHDQGLPLFKSHYGFIGVNITLGLPFIRLSVDHGTAFEIYGKNTALYQGCHYLLKQALFFHRGKN